MSLKAILFDFNGVIINDESIHEKLIEQLLIEENLTIKPGEYRTICLGRSDRVCVKELLAKRGRVVSETYLTQLLNRKAESYVREIEKGEKLPLYPGLDDLLFQARARNLKIGIVSGAIRKEIDLILNRANLAQHFKVIVADDDITTSKPDPHGYLLAVKRLNQEYPDLNLLPEECLAIEDTFAGIQAAKQAGMQVVGVAHTYPFHMLQRQANWTIDYLSDLELERVQELYAQKNG
ncbi:HAD-IA family hydrolase [Scytonema sp. UIC 10036]|uniref:HAD family hydrolase n=1 Tax=Scytonema sp. UIC 10036 TaxID=2304196 RepID=UPI0012DA3A6F|nr:HAD family phosphatase [Scytonema sp. UIC 10036]MUG93890.1 HAD-IA family hydrolase [Scytonema sp. UIC 10036]